MEIIAADSGEKDKACQSSRRGGPQQQPACLPDHQYGTQGNVKAAEDKKVESAFQHDYLNTTIVPVETESLI